MPRSMIRTPRNRSAPSCPSGCRSWQPTPMSERDAFFWSSPARLTGSTVDAGGKTAYSWVEVERRGATNACEPLPGGRQGSATASPAYERNEATATIDDVVEMAYMGPLG